MGKGRNVQAISAVMMLLVLLFSGGQLASASFEHCFPGCAVGCLFGSDHKFVCVLKCFGKCLIGVGSTSGLDYCKLGCAVDQCAYFGNDFNIEDVDSVNNCVNECEIGKCGLLAQALASTISGDSEKLSPTGAP